ncbi:MAG: nucleotidyltransferase domain-containing protein [Chloroflexi bacterium]|nr:nucleotidyltransferase domain-containing protein [Ardenticatenaceae bacterium]MBL1128321.1 nucleotidyltransferase domain-containing protein [Chloroflexota bacterium]NOG34395.1 nucleotidyltransferase domain-containing protein [Chloroflexota bacterium]GIK55976.1 MAG: nucleotidyltransferase [Chloroflexota bacterium]
MLTDAQLNQVLQEVVDILQADYEPDEVILFGSYAYGRPHSDSDLDLFIVKDSAERPLDRRLQVRELLQPVNARMPLTLYVLTPVEMRQRLAMGDQFLQEIIGKGKVLYVRDGFSHPN